MENIEKTKKIDLESMKEFAPKVIKGTKKLKAWSESL